MTYQNLAPSLHDLLSVEECNQIRDEVLAQESRWVQRPHGPGFFTLGAASYLDAPGKRKAYLEEAKEGNPLLWSSFKPLYEKVRKFFQTSLGDKVFFDKTYALPGFHVFVLDGKDRSDDNVAKRAHFDLQFLHALPGFIPTGTLSFTLSIEEPTGGSAMELWELRYLDPERVGCDLVDYATKNVTSRLEYELGRVVVHDGLSLHAIGRPGIKAPTGRRITLQGHGVRSETSPGWMLYW